MPIRVARITAFTVVLIFLFEFSRRVSDKLGNEDVPGLLAAVGVVALLFSIRAVVTESAMGPEAAGQKDFLWGVSLGCWTTILVRLIEPYIAN
ncbi:MAG: hypothetical protein E4H00_07105 [Myxococcales bacterium]|nr:MAG: hypothetical protein E4H00_07105 [Myxococcales bacterium]